jgi:peptidoglycan L-alanyl-D-glutamate endopeptidase CwlK
MPRFSFDSKKELYTCDQRLIKVAEAAIQYWDFTVVDGHRTKEEQERAFYTGRSKVHWPEGPHCANPSKAFDLAPYPIDWNNTPRFLLFGGKIIGLARSMGIELRYGGDWDGDGNPRNQTFNDVGHFELKEEIS